jgi:MFS family permease
VSPLVTMTLFGKRAFSAGLVTALVFFAGMIGLMLSLSLLLQIGLHYSPIHTGLTFAAWSLGAAIGAGAGAGALAPKFGRPVLHLGLVIMLAGMLGMLAVVHATGDDLSTWKLFVPELFAGIGMGMALAPLFDFVLAAVDEHEVGSASGMLNAVQQLGAALGIAVLGTVFFSYASHHGMVAAFERNLWVECGLLIALTALVFVLPKRAREGDVVH